MSTLRKRATPPFTRRGVSFGSPAKRFWKRFRSDSASWEEFKSQSRRWRRFSSVLCGQNAELLELLANSSVSISLQAGTTQRAAIQELGRAAVASMPIDYLSPALENSAYDHGFCFSGVLGMELDLIARDHPDMWWWISDLGLVMANIDAEALIVLSSFNQLAGALFYRKAIAKRLSRSALAEIAKELDAAGYPLKENLQPAHWLRIAAHNQKFSRRPIKNFENAVTLPFSAHYVRKRLYVARDAYRKAFLEVR